LPRHGVVSACEAGGAAADSTHERILQGVAAGPGPGDEAESAQRPRGETGSILCDMATALSARYSVNAAELLQQAKEVFPETVVARDGFELEVPFAAED